MIDPSFQKEINDQLDQFFTTKKKLGQKFDSRIGELVEQIADVTLRGGDRQRPYFAYLGYISTGGKNWRQILPVLIALEVFHTAALIHDDIMDEADIRRGGQTIHAHFTQNLRNRLKSTSLAILAGDLCLTWSHELFNQVDYTQIRHSGDPPAGGDSRIRSWTSQDDNMRQARHLFFQMQEEVAFGQVSDVWGMEQVGLEELLKMYQAKSGNYSVEKPLLIGASLARASEKQKLALSHYGQKVGLAFQIKDDLLGIFGDEKILGKSVSGDLMEQKWTLVVAKTVAKLNPDQKIQFLTLFHKKTKSAADLAWLKAEIVRTQAKKGLEKEMEKLVAEAKKELEQIKFAQKQKLLDIADFIIFREV